MSILSEPYRPVVPWNSTLAPISAKQSLTEALHSRQLPSFVAPEILPGMISFSVGPTRMTIDPDRVALGVMGCRPLGCYADSPSHDIPDSLKLAWDLRFEGRENWARQESGKALMPNTLCAAAQQANVSGLTLVDIIAEEDSNWHPGAFISQVIRRLGSDQSAPIPVVCLRVEDFCLPEDLVALIHDDPTISFHEIAAHYSGYLRTTPGLLEKASSLVLMECAWNRLPIFYTEEPHVPDFADPQDMLRVPYAKRGWLEANCFFGCYRVVLAEEIIRFLLGAGCSVKLFELDVTRQRTLRRDFRPGWRSCAT